MKLKLLRKEEDELMLLLWKKGSILMSDILSEIPSFALRRGYLQEVLHLLEDHFLVGTRFDSGLLSYYPLSQRNEYLRFYLNRVFTGYFKGSFRELMKFFDEHDIDDAEFEPSLSRFKESALKVSILKLYYQEKYPGADFEMHELKSTDIARFEQTLWPFQRIICSFPFETDRIVVLMTNFNTLATFEQIAFKIEAPEEILKIVM